MVSYKSYNPVGKAINAVKTARTALGIELFTELVELTELTHWKAYKVPEGTDIILRKLSCVWAHPEDTKAVFWRKYNYLLRQLYLFWEEHGVPSKTVPTENEPWHWNFQTW